jgi:hypothetical protein
MRYLLLHLAVATCLSPIGAFAQTADFKCPKPGIIVQFTNGQQQTWGRPEVISWGSQQTTFCNVQTDGQPSSLTNRKAWYAPAAVLDAGGPGAYAQQTKIYTIWPLSVGKKVSGRFDGSTGANFQGGSRQMSSTVTIQVERYEKLTTKAGTFDVFVVSSSHEDISSPFKFFMREWYTPETGIVVKREAHNNTGMVNWSAEAVTVTRPQ